MNQEIKQRWIEALRSGEYQQGRDSLFHCGKFCNEIAALIEEDKEL